MSDNQLNIYRFQLENEEIEVTRYMPKHGSGHPILVAPGWGETMRTFEGVLIELTKLNRPIYGITHQREHIPPGSFRDPIKLQHYKAHNIIAVVDMLKLSHVDVLGHSESAINVVLAAEKRPDLFDRILLVAPAGISMSVGWLNFFTSALHKLFADLLYAARDSKRRAVFYRHSMEGIKYQLAHPIRSFFELISISKTDLRSLLDKVSEHNSIKLVLMDQEKIYPSVAMMAHLVDLNIEIDIVEGYHDEIHYNPSLFLEYFEPHKIQTEPTRAKSSPKYKPRTD